MVRRTRYLGWGRENIKRKINLLTKKLRRAIVLRCKRIFLDEILVLGDSHASVFSNKKFKSLLPGYFFNVVKVAGATVSGLKNPNPKTKALPIFMHGIKHSKAAITILLIGEVDTGFVIWYRAEKNNISVTKALDKAIENYQKLIKEVSKKSRVICISTPLPTIQDGYNCGDVANARNDVNATQLQRTELTVQFNKIMQKFCERNGYVYLSFDEESVGENGLVVPYLLNSDPTDHHYDMEKYADMIINKLKRSIEQGALSDINSTERHCRQ